MWREPALRALINPGWIYSELPWILAGAALCRQEALNKSEVPYSDISLQSAAGLR